VVPAFAITRRCFIALRSSPMAFPQTKDAASARTRQAFQRLKSSARDVLIWFTKVDPK